MENTEELHGPDWWIKWREQRGHKPPRKRSYVPKPSRCAPTLADRAVRWLLAWERDDYPGIGKGAMSALNAQWSEASINKWRNGRRKLPVLAAEMLSDLIKSRCQAALVIVEELQNDIAKRKDEIKRYGCVRVDEATGLDGRNRSGHTH